MNILPITPYLQNNFSAQRKELNNSVTVIQPKYYNTLQKDTVSFSGKIPNKIADFVEVGLSKEQKRFERIATTYLDVLESVAAKLEDYGVSFDREYCELNPVKSPQSYTSKIIRSGSFNVPDTIRATLYMKDPYDLSILNDKLLPEMEKRGYVLSHIEVNPEELRKKGYSLSAKEAAKPYIKIPDLDIRLEDAAEQADKLAPELKFAIGKPQKSGYEDIQMRFVREYDTKRSPVQHELIILFGQNYAMAKHIESEKIYNQLRQLDELHISFDEMKDNPHALKAKRYIDLLKQMFRGKVSEKLFLNAKNKDLYDMSEEVSITFSDTDKQVFESYFAELLDRLNSYYKELRKSAQVSPSATKQLNSDAKQDRAVIQTVQAKLKDAIEYFNRQHDLKQNEH